LSCAQPGSASHEAPQTDPTLLAQEAVQDPGAGQVFPQRVATWLTQLAAPQLGAHLPPEHVDPVGHWALVVHVHLPVGSQAPLAHWAPEVHIGEQQPGRAAQMAATQGSQAGLSAVPEVHGSCAQAPS
jgi:hypothetical protein